VKAPERLSRLPDTVPFEAPVSPASPLSWWVVEVTVAAAVTALSVVSFVAARTLWLDTDPFVVGEGGALDATWAPVFGILLLARATLYWRTRPTRARHTQGYADEAVDGIRVALYGTVATAIGSFAIEGIGDIKEVSFSRGVFLFELLFAAALYGIALPLVKAGVVELRRRGHNSRSVVVVGCDELTARFVEEALRHPETGYRVVGTVGDDRAVAGVPWLGPSGDLAAILTEHQPEEVVLSGNLVERGRIYELMSWVHPKTLVRAVPALGEVPARKTGVTTLADFPLVELGVHPETAANRALKRALDIAVATVTLLVTGLPMLLIAALVKLDSRGPVLFHQRRVGMDGRMIVVPKFRTMHVDGDDGEHRAYVAAQLGGTATSDEHTGQYKLVGDPRVTRVGRFLRRFSLDELPQLVNLLAGTMSAVGPRPAIPYEVELYEPWQRHRLDVRPGLTGLWQVSGRSRLSYTEMIELDLEYIAQWSLWLDLTILLRTPAAVLRRNHAS